MLDVSIVWHVKLKAGLNIGYTTCVLHFDATYSKNVCYSFDSLFTCYFMIHPIFDFLDVKTELYLFAIRTMLLKKV